MKRDQIIAIVKEKSQLKQQIFDNTLRAMENLKEMLAEYAAEANEELEGSDRRVRMEYRDRGKFEAQLQIAGDVLIFSMHSNIFKFDRSHLIWRNSYVEKDPSNVYCGMINIYNFLSDSIKYNRMDDLGYLVGRIFINRENQYFVEGKRQIEMRHSNFGQGEICFDGLRDIVERSILYALDFDLLTPPYDMVKEITVESFNSKLETSRLQTGKRLGYQFNSDDV